MMMSDGVCVVCGVWCVVCVLLLIRYNQGIHTIGCCVYGVVCAA